MAGLETVHEWSDGETIVDDDLNSIKAGVGQELDSGSIPASKLVWPFIAQGNIDLNGYDLRNFSSLLGAIHVNDDKTLETALTEAGDNSIIVLDSGTTNDITALNLTIYGKSNVTIVGNGVKVVIGSTVTTAGITVDSSSENITFDGVRFTGGTPGKPAVLVAASTNVQFVNCIFETYVGVKVGSSITTAYDCKVQDCKFNNCDLGLYIFGSNMGNFDRNTFYSCTLGITLPSNSEGECKYNTFNDNKFRDISSSGCITANWTGSISATRGYNKIERNIFETNGTNPTLNIVGYYHNEYKSNLFGGPVTLSGTLCIIDDNTFLNTPTINGTNMLFKDNDVTGDISVTAGSRVWLLNNKFTAIMSLTTDKHPWWSGNIFAPGTTVSLGDSYTSDDNYGI